MGEAGQWSRMAAKALGSLWSYYCLPDGKTAPGQIDLNQYQHEQFHEAPIGSSIFGIIGNPVTHSLSPRIHNAFFVAQIITVFMFVFPVMIYKNFLICCHLKFKVFQLQLLLSKK